MKYYIITIFALILAISGCNGTTTVITHQQAEKDAPQQAAGVYSQADILDGQEGQEVSIKEVAVANIEPIVPEDQKIVIQEVISEIPSSVQHSVPFTSQAPFAVWDDLHGETCEEASMLMATRFIDGKSLTAESAEAVLLDLVKWEEERGYKIDLTIQETQDIFKNYFGYDSKIVSEVTPNRIKKEIADGNIIIVPAAGRLLGNPNFQNPGPIYHMLLITGYSRTKFITNDPGTRRGEDFKYDQKILINAIHDWDHSLSNSNTNTMTEDDIKTTPKLMLVVSPQ